MQMGALLEEKCSRQKRALWYDDDTATLLGTAVYHGLYLPAVTP